MPLQRIQSRNPRLKGLSPFSGKLSPSRLHPGEELRRRVVSTPGRAKDAVITTTTMPVVDDPSAILEKQVPMYHLDDDNRYIIIMVRPGAHLPLRMPFPPSGCRSRGQRWPVHVVYTLPSAHRIRL